MLNPDRRGMEHPEAQRLAALVETATIVGLGTSTRAGNETFRLVEQTTHALIQRGFRVVALLDNQRVGDLYDRYVRGEDVDLDAALAQAWGPWRTIEMRDALVRFRRHNERHPDDPVRIIGIAGPATLPADYDRVVALLAAMDRAIATRVDELFEVIRTAHASGEHVLRLHGTHTRRTVRRTRPHRPRPGRRAGRRPGVRRGAAAGRRVWSTSTPTHPGADTTPSGRSVPQPSDCWTVSAAPVPASCSGKAAPTSRSTAAS